MKLPSTLELTAVDLKEKITKKKYHLNSFIIHQGRLKSKGHYVAFCKLNNKNCREILWRSCDDEEVKFEKLIPSQLELPYVLFYEEQIKTNDGQLERNTSWIYEDGSTSSRYSRKKGGSASEAVKMKGKEENNPKQKPNVAMKRKAAQMTAELVS